MKQEPMTLGISACLMGHPLRYDGGMAKAPPIVKKMFNDYQFQGYCPEVAAGMSVPREAVRLVDNAGDITIIGANSHYDWTDELEKATETIINLVQVNKLCGYILKSKSPSCGLSSAKIYRSGNISKTKVSGFFAHRLQQQVHIPLIEAEMLNCSRMAEKFIQLTWLANDFYKLDETLNKHSLTTLFARHKLSLMAYSPYHYKKAGSLLGNINGKDLQTVKDDLYLNMFEGFNRLSSHKRHTNALMHIQGYFKKMLNASEKKELTQLIKNYSEGFVPLSVPLTLIRHYLLLYPNEYLQQQNYIEHKLEHYGFRNYL